MSQVLNPASDGDGPCARSTTTAVSMPSLPSHASSCLMARSLLQHDATDDNQAETRAPTTIHLRPTGLDGLEPSVQRFLDTLRAPSSKQAMDAGACRAGVRAGPASTLPELVLSFPMSRSGPATAHSRKPPRGHLDDITRH